MALLAHTTLRRLEMQTELSDESDIFVTIVNIAECIRLMMVRFNDWC
jgi:hypothetical protein